ncbi:MAG: S8 family serine peptidase, partial [Thermoplasmata archaeon]
PWRRIAAVLAVLAIGASFLGGVAAGPAGHAVSIVTGFPVRAEFVPNDSGWIDQWGLRRIQADDAWDVTLGSSSVVVAIIDTGVWWTHNDLQANMWTNPTDGSHGRDFVDGDSNPMDVDPTGGYHGTGVSGVTAAITNNGAGVAGTAQVSIMALRALGPSGQGSSLNTSQAIRWATDHNAKIINLSLGTNETFVGPTDIQLAVDYAWSRGALIVAAAGNAGSSTLDYPARLSNVVSVAAIDESGQRAGFSNFGAGLDISAPGNRILTLDGNNAIKYVAGTSFAAPFVSGVAALLLSMDGNLTNVDLWNILNATAVQPGGGTGSNTNYGWGVVNAWNAINALNQPLISLYPYATSVSRSSTFGFTWKILGPAGLVVSDTHVVWGTASGQLGNATPTQTGMTGQTYSANGLSIPSGSDTLVFKVVAMVNGTQYESPERTVFASSLPDFLFVLYQLLASNLLFLALFILVLAGVVAFIP